jgi:hypothetical protein
MSRSEAITRRGLLGAAALTALALNSSRLAEAHNGCARGRVVQLVKGHAHGVGGVLVSNGVEVVRSDADGTYCLPMRESIFVIKPAHWSLPLDLTTGAPAFASTQRLMGAAADASQGDFGESIDFVIARTPEPKAFSAALFADTQPADHQELAYLRRAMKKMSHNHKFSFGLGLGDIAADNLSIYEEYQREIAQLGIPVWHIPGNHDHDSNAVDLRSRLKTWRSRFGAPTYAFEYSGALFIMLDNVKVVAGGGYVGEIGAAGLAFVRNLLAHTPTEKLVIVCSHIPLISSHGGDPSCVTSDAQALLRLLDGRKAVSFSGHMHTSEHHYLPTPSGALHHHQIVAAFSGSWWSGPFDLDGRPIAVSSDGTPPGWHILSIDGDDYETTFVSAKEDAFARAVVTRTLIEGLSHAPLVRVGEAVLPTWLMVNVFDGGPRTNVSLDFAGERRTLRRVHAADPYVERIFREAGSSLKYWVRAEASSHLWALEGVDTIESDLSDARLTVVDEFGRTRIADAQLLFA